MYGKKPFLIRASYDSFDQSYNTSKPISLKATFDEYYKQDALVVSPYGVYSLSINSPYVKNNLLYLAPKSIDSLSIGDIALKNKGSFVGVNSWVSSGFGAPASIINYNKEVAPKGWASSSYGYQYAYNLTQYRSIKGYNASLYGKPYVQGGVKYLATRGVDTSTYGKTVVTNTTANREVEPGGINSLAIGRLNVSPRIIYPVGMYQLNVGTHHIYDPAIKPLGVDHTTYGEATAWYHTRPVQPVGFLSLNTGYPVVFDPTQEIQAISLVTSAIFGDTALKNTTAFINTSGIDDLVVTPWAVVTNSNRYYAPNGIDSQAFGGNSIRNKTPSIFVDGIKPHGIGAAAIGYAIRKIGATGFDRLLLGKPLITKTPELLPKTFSSGRVSNLAFISHGIRYLLPVGHNSNEHGEHTLWFRYRYVEPQSWQSSKFGQANLTHGVRELIASGFIRQVYGNAWVSYGTRQLAPIGINKIHHTRHLVGGTRHLNPVGYVATLFGTRIIPENQYAYPQGFAGAFGLNGVILDTQYLRPSGYISVGQQPADRWGNSLLYNKTQYVFQEFDISNGLTPPKWSDWTLIESRNKTIGVVGFNPLRFGYPQLDNNAALLSALGVPPPVSDRFNVSMIDHAIRVVNLDGVEPPPISDWGVVYNGARVMRPISISGLSTGQPIVKNTRRYYRNVGRFESLEVGTPAIGYRIRTIDIEKRYSIEPPQINLPTVDLYTRYIDLVGYEPDAYGLPSLSIYFNIIAPKWNYGDKHGYPQLKNVTPELGVYGHNSEDFGAAAIRTEWREVKAQGDTATLIGLHKISDTKQSITINGWRDTVVSQKPTVIKTGTNPYVLQNIFLNNESDPTKDGYGIYEGFVGKPSFNQNVLYLIGIKSQRFGDLFIWSNNLQVDVGMAIPNFGYGTSVINKVRAIDFNNNNEYKPIPSQIAVGKPVLSPMTIWAVMEAPQQARDNHYLGGSRTLHFVGHPPNGSTKRPFGTAKIESTIRSINLDKRGIGYYRIELPQVELSIRTISPESFRRLAFGVPSIPYTGKDIQVKSEYSFDVYGKSVVSRSDKGPKTIAAKGRDSLSVGNSSIDNYRRWLLAYGMDNLLIGKSVKDDTPFMWQGLRVGEHVPFVVGGDDLSIIGEHSISLRIREIALDGFNAFLCEYDVENFDKRLRVITTPVNNQLSQGLEVQGVDTGYIGKLEIKLGQHFIRPDGNADQFRKSGYSAEFGAPTIRG